MYTVLGKKAGNPSAYRISHIAKFQQLVRAPRTIASRLLWSVRITLCSTLEYPAFAGETGRLEYPTLFGIGRCEESWAEMMLMLLA